jgi:toxin ParE1/3/4
MRRIRLSQAAQSDIIEILAWSHAQFGEDARQRYEALIAAAIRDVARMQTSVVSTERPELGPGVQCWHLRQSRRRSKAAIVQRPRHFLLYRIEEAIVVIGRVLHDAMELRGHLDPDRDWE